MDLEDTGHLTRIRFLIRDRDAQYPALIDKILGTTGIATVPTGVRIPRMNSIMERWVKTLRVELLDRTLIWNQAHSTHALPLEPGEIERLTIDQQGRLGGVIHEYRHAA